jgi:cell fate (sporulation/competence/biofilm development) regulator YlbF (YheA/YmcA/DUF963 family)
VDNEIKVIDNNQPAQIQISQDAPPMVQIAQMMQAGLDIDVDKMAKLQEIGEKYETNEARKSFFAAISIVQSEIEGVHKTKKNAQTNSKYATLDDVIEVAKPVYTKHGFSVVFSEGKADTAGDIRICADVMHKDGHERAYYHDLALDDKGIKGSVNKTQIHGKASSVSYGRRYLMCMIWNIPTPDNDGNGNKKKPVVIAFPTELEWECVDAIIKALPPEPQIDREKLAKWFLADKGKYPATKKMVPQASEYVMQKNPTNIYIIKE